MIIDIIDVEYMKIRMIVAKDDPGKSHLHILHLWYSMIILMLAWKKSLEDFPVSKSWWMFIDFPRSMWVCRRYGIKLGDSTRFHKEKWELLPRRMVVLWDVIGFIHDFTMKLWLEHGDFSAAQQAVTSPRRCCHHKLSVRLNRFRGIEKLHTILLLGYSKVLQQKNRRVLKSWYPKGTPNDFHRFSKLVFHILQHIEVPNPWG